jgi:GTP cyclohydrolase II
MPVEPAIPSVQCHVATRISSSYGNYRILLYTSSKDDEEHLALVFGGLESASLNAYRDDDTTQLRLRRGAKVDVNASLDHNGIAVVSGNGSNSERTNGAANSHPESNNHISNGAAAPINCTHISSNGSHAGYHSLHPPDCHANGAQTNGATTHINGTTSGNTHNLPANTSTDPVLVRIHSCCFTGETIGSTRCDCGEQLSSSLRQMSERGRGALLYLKQEGRGIGLRQKLLYIYLIKGIQPH